MWAESRVTPGQYTGQQKITPLSREAHNTGYQAWAKKVLLLVCSPSIFHPIYETISLQKTLNAICNFHFVRECSMGLLQLGMGLV
jgi:hypothetical protein